MGKVPQITSVYVNSAQQIDAGPPDRRGITFSATAVITPEAQSNRLNAYVKDAK